MGYDLGDLIYKLTIDDKNASAKLKKFDSSMKSLGTNLTKVGTSLSKNVTLPLIALGGIALKTAADFEVANRKFVTAFKGSEKAALSAVDAYSKSFGVAKSQATALFAFTGDLLKGFGATSDEALKLTNRTNELAAALSAYNGIPVAQASKAVTSALLGETEQMKMLGVVIRQSDVDAEILLRGQEDLEGQAKLLARAEATLALAYNQSSDAVSSFTENTETLAFQSQALIGDLKDLSVEFGTALLPVMKDVVKGLREATSWFSDLSDTQKENIVKAAALAAAIGPVLIGMGKLAGAVKVVGLAFQSALGPIGLLIAAVIALGVAVSKLHLDKLAKELGDIADATGVADEEMRAFTRSAAKVRQAVDMVGVGKDIDQVTDSVAGMAKQFKLTEEQVLLILLADESISDVQRELLLQAQDINNEQIRISQAVEGTRLSHNAIRDSLAAEAESASIIADETSVTTEELAAQAELRKQLEDRYIAARANVISVLKSEQTEYQNIQDQIDELNKSPWLPGQLEDDRIKAVELLQQRQADIILAQEKETSDKLEAIEKERLDAILEMNNENQSRLLESQLNDIQLLEYQRDNEIKLAEETGANVTDIEIYYANKITELRDAEIERAQNDADKLKVIEEKKAEELKTIEIDRLNAILAMNNDNKSRLLESRLTDIQLLENKRDKEIELAKSTGADIADIERYYSDKIAKLKDDAAKRDKERAIQTTQDIIAAMTKLAGSIADIYSGITDVKLNQVESDKVNQINALDKTLLSDEEYADAKEEIERDAADKEYDIKLKAYKTQKALDISETVFSTGLAAMRAYSSLAGIPIIGPILGVIAAAAAVAFGAVQIAKIKTQAPPAKPAFAEGGILPGVPGGFNATVGEVPEAILPLNDKTLGALGGAIAQSTSGTTSRSGNSSGDVNIYAGGDFITKIKNGVQNLLDDRQLTLPSVTIV